MTHRAAPPRFLLPRRAVAVLLVALGTAALAQPGSRLARGGPAWNDLSNAERSALAPLQRDWPAIDAERKQKWREVAARFPNMPEDERARAQSRMSEWARMTPQERGQARLGFQRAQGFSAEEREARWEAYQALPPEQRRQLASRSALSGEPGRRAEARAGRDSPRSKPNIVPNPTHATPPKPVAPSVVQAKPGASTTLMSRNPAPPPHQQAGLPKIAAQPEFVDRQTLLPQRGPQAAAARTARSAPEATDRARGK